MFRLRVWGFDAENPKRVLPKNASLRGEDNDCLYFSGVGESLGFSRSDFGAADVQIIQIILLDEAMVFRALGFPELSLSVRQG